MSFQPKITTVLSTDGVSILTTDITGAYNAGTNPTGYGAPNPLSSSPIILRWKLYNSSTWITIAVTQATLAAGFNITNAILGISGNYVQPINPQIATPQAIPDGVEFTQLLVLSALLTSGQTTPGSNSVGIVGIGASAFTNINYIAFSSDLTNIYQILSVTSTYIILDKPYAGTSFTDIPVLAYNADSLLINVVNANTYIDNILASVTSEELDGNLLNKTFKRFMEIGIAQSRFNQQDYYGADLILQNLYTDILQESTINGY